MLFMAIFTGFMHRIQIHLQFAAVITGKTVWGKKNEVITRVKTVWRKTGLLSQVKTGCLK